MLEYVLAWMLIGFGLATLTEGYHRFRQFADAAGRPLRYWWLAGLIGAVGLGLISLGFGLEPS